MTPAQRETLRKMLNLTMLQAAAYAPGTGTRIRMDAKVDALRAALVERTCGTRKHWSVNRRGAADHCAWLKRSMDPDDGCIQGWQAREGEGWTR